MTVTRVFRSLFARGTAAHDQMEWVPIILWNRHSDLARQLRRLLQDARKAGIHFTFAIAIENHFNYPSPCMVDLLKMVDDPHLGVCVDVSNSICAGEWTEETVGLLASFTINLHLKGTCVA